MKLIGASIRKLLLLPASLMLVGLLGCPPQQTSTLPPATNGGGWILSTGVIDNAVIGAAPETTVSGVWQSDSSGAHGDPSSWEVTTNAVGYYPLDNARVPAAWKFTWISSQTAPPDCDGVTTTGTPSFKNQVEEFNCIIIEVEGEAESGSFTFNPSPLNPASIPETATITGSGFVRHYGMPVVQYFDLNGNLVAQQAASSVSADGTTLSLIPPPISEMTAGTYAGIINNINGDGSYEYAGTTAVNVSLPIYRPTTYSDAGSAATYLPQGPTVGTTAGQIYTTEVNAWDTFDSDQSGNIYNTGEGQGQCTWSGFPSFTDSADHTLYIPYQIDGSGQFDDTASYSVSATIGNSNTILFSSDLGSGSGLITADVPAGTNLSTIQVTVAVYPENQNATNPETITEGLHIDVYVQ